MRRKISTVIDEALFRRVKLESVRQGRQITEILSEALEAYLRTEGGRRATTGIVASSWGVLALPRSRAQKIVRDEPGLFDD